MKCFCCQKGHVRADCLVWKKVMEEEEKISKPKVGINVAMVEWDQLVIDVCVTMQGQRASMPIEEPLETKVSPTKGQWTKWEKKNKVHSDVVEELQKIQKFKDRPIEVEMLPANLGPAKLVTQLGRLNGEVPLGMTKGSWFAKWSQKVNKIDQSICQASKSWHTNWNGHINRKANMIGSKHIVNGSDKSTRKVDLMKVSESQKNDNSLNKDKSTF